MQYLFPFKKITRDSNILIYGAGRVGQEYLWQVRLTQYANVVCVVDGKFPDIADLGVKMDCPQNIEKYEFDFIVVAVADNNARQEIMNRLNQELMVPGDKIICDIQYPPNRIQIAHKGKICVDGKFAYEQAGLPIAVHVSGGLGDMVVYKRFMDELIRWSDDICVDVFVRPSSCVDVMKSFLSGCMHINQIIDADCYCPDDAKYSFEFLWGIDLELLKYDTKDLKRYPQILDWIIEIKSINAQNGMLMTGKMQSIFFARCEKEGVWRYTAYNRYPGFDIQDYHTAIPLNSDYNDVAIQLCDGPYLTINYGWGRNIKQAKVWPKEYNEKLIKMIHDRFGKVKVVQVGGANFPQLAGCDKYVLGYDLEIVKYILKNSLIHIDCEGGLVHLATQLGTHCIVLFGPTPIKFYGYPDNINIQAGKCHNCYWLVDNMYECYRGMEEPECMYSITPEIVFKAVNNYLSAVLVGVD